MATVAGLLFALAAVASPRYGVLAWLARQARLRREFAADLLIAHLGQRENHLVPGPAASYSAESTATTGLATPIADLQTRFRWSVRFTRAVVREVARADLVRPVASRSKDNAGTNGASVDFGELVLTDSGRMRASELLAK
jgi:hypothetical protein